MKLHLFGRIFNFYCQGFRSMRTGRTLWTIILIKLVLLVALARLLFPDHLEENFATDQARAAHVLGQLTVRSSSH